MYAGSGNPSDYDWLAQHGVNVKGKIVLVRYSVPYSYRGFKALTAAQRGAAGILIYSDPAEDGFRKGATYPNGPWGPEPSRISTSTSVERFGDAFNAFQRHAMIERTLLDAGWQLDGFESERVTLH